MGETIPHRPDVVVWPETMFPYPMFQTDADVEVNAALIIGIDTLVAHRSNYDHFNSAAFITPEKGLSDRYDKIHRVPFGEYIPLRDTLPFLHKLTPFGDAFGI